VTVSKESLYLGIETSCDECSAAVIGYSPHEPIRVLSLSTFSQTQLHEPFGGVVPEVASRNHLETVNHMVDRALNEANLSNHSARKNLQAICVTNRPGLVGALLVGVSAAKALAYAWEKPLVGVHHLEGHALSPWLEQHEPMTIEYPAVIAVVSGGHTNLYLAKTPPELWAPNFLNKSLIGSSRDDAAGEAFDKTAKLVGFPYPGGIWIDRESQGGNPEAFPFPRALPQKESLEFSFSGLKTSVSLVVQKLKKEGTLEARKKDLCASIQAAIVDALYAKIKNAIRIHGAKALLIVGGVAANSRLRSHLQNDAEVLRELGLTSAPIFPNLKYCSDNAAMIAAAGAFRHRQGNFLTVEEAMTLNAIPYPSATE